MNETFIIEEDSGVRRSDFVLTGWETVVFELEDEPRCDDDAQKIGFCATMC